MLHKVTIAGLTMDPTSNTPIVILKTEDGDEAIPIWIGILEATAIASALQGVKFDRPMTHDLFRNFANKLNVRLEHVEVCDIQNNTYYARIHYTVNDKTEDLDARPSDAIALALRFEVPIFVDSRVIQKSSTGESSPDAMDTSEEGKKWADYLEKLSAEDFGKYKV